MHLAMCPFHLRTDGCRIVYYKWKVIYFSHLHEHKCLIAGTSRFLFVQLLPFYEEALTDDRKYSSELLKR